MPSNTTGQMGIFHLEMPHTCTLQASKHATPLPLSTYACLTLMVGIVHAVVYPATGSSCPQTAHILNDLETETKSLKHRARHITHVTSK
jgi:hypothetical protein